MTSSRDRFKEALRPFLDHMAEGLADGVGSRHRERVPRPLRARVYRLFRRRWPDPIASQLLDARIADARECVAHIARFKDRA